MGNPIQFVKICPVLLLLLFLFGSVGAAAAADALTLDAMEKQENVGATRIVLTFSMLPEFDLSHSGQRVDLLLKGTQVAADLRKLPEDETVVKILLAQKYEDLLASFLLRRPPQQVQTETRQRPAQIVLDLIWEGESEARPGVAFRISGMPPRKAGKAAKELQKSSPWQGRWREFYREYRSPWTVQLPTRYSLPSLPRLVVDQQSPLGPLQQFADEGMWLSLLSKAPGIAELSEQQLYLRNLLMAEAQLRTEDYAAGLARLELLNDQQGPQQNRVEYLTAYGQAASGQPFVAQLSLVQLLPKLTDGMQLTLPATLLSAEIALAAKQPKKALDFLQNGQLNWPLELLPIVDLRRADALAASGQLEQAVTIYRGLVEEPKLFENYPAALNTAAYSAYQTGAYSLAYDLYRRLGELVTELPGADLVQFAIGASAYDSGNIDWGRIGLQKAQLDWPGEEGGERAELRLLDYQLLGGGELELARAADEYGRIGRQSGSRTVREESIFKQALAHYLLKEYQASVDELMAFRRNYASSKLRREVDLLLLEQIPLVVHKLLEQKQDLDAVVLVEKNRKLLLTDSFDPDFLNDLAEAFDNLGLYARAGRVLLYMFDHAENEAQRQPLYLPLAQSFLKRGEFLKASEYADRYLQQYPQGPDSGALFGVLLDAFARQDRDDELLAWLDRKDRPRSPELEVRAAWLYWRLERPQGVVDSLEMVQQLGAELEVKEMALLGESYFQLRRNRAAEKIYRQLESDQQYRTQARYRRAQLLLRGQQRGEALKLLKQTVDEDGGSAWGKLARDLLIQEQR